MYATALKIHKVFQFMDQINPCMSLCPVRQAVRQSGVPVQANDARVHLFLFIFFYSHLRQCTKLEHPTKVAQRWNWRSVDWLFGDGRGANEL